MTTLVSAHEPARSLTYRAAVLAFGVLAYTMGLVAFVALIAAMLALLPFTGGPIGELSLGSALALDLVLLVAFALQHSVMARPSFKARWTRVVPAAAERSTYVLATGLVLAPLLVLWQPMPAIIWSVEASLLRRSLLGVALAG